MCKCNPNIRTPYCGKGACMWPKDTKEELKVENNNPCMYVFINKSLNMSKGKMTAQGIHASIMSAIDAHDSARKFWTSAMHRTVLVMEARDSEHIKNIETYLKERKFKTYLIIDEGVNEIDPHVPTALATGILNKEQQETRDALSTFRLFRETMRVVVELDV